MSGYIKEKVRGWLALPELEGVNDLDDPNTSELHSRIIQNKPFLKKIYLENYQEVVRFHDSDPDAVIVELGSGGGFIKQVIPEAITSDVLVLSSVDVCFSGEHIPFKNDSVGIFFMIDVFHHIKTPRSVLTEMERCLKPGVRLS